MSRQPEVRLDDLYQEVILDHNKRPRNFKALLNANRYAHGVNPLCGDDYELYLDVGEDGRIREVGFQGHGCAISKSSASLMTTAIEGKNASEASELQKSFIDLLTAEKAQSAARLRVGNLKIFEGVKQFPVRVKCATLIWRALEEALKDEKTRSEVTTEKGGMK